jgi:hypothetical protein
MRGRANVKTTRERMMAWTISGTYAANCSCRLICPCPVDGTPTGPGDKCHGVGVFSIAKGSSDDLDLSGVNVGLVNRFPSNISAGNIEVGIVVDEGASDEQFSALERIFKGEEGGPFGELSALFGNWLGAERAAVTFSGGDTPSFSIGDSSATFEPLVGPDGSHTTVKGAAFGFAPEFRVGRGPGHMSALGVEFDGSYGETADFEFSSEQAEDAPKGR